ncbi:hypothetical protein [Treponema sp.]|uniref:hypothetical protein n=1 Tax=Treponema sp. TaxID=166 RepID=UPI0025F44A71|nr:hypothetical protein [Treponema sp.]MCR5219188.1 hypothetical protein [Treponema sp.]
MSAEFLKDLIGTIVYILPVLVLVWKGAKLTARLEHLEQNVKEKTDKFCRDHALMQEKIEQERIATDSSITAIMATLTEIQKSLVRVETKLDVEEKK